VSGTSIFLVALDKSAGGWLLYGGRRKGSDAGFIPHVGLARKILFGADRHANQTADIKPNNSRFIDFSFFLF
jgi:hypothetical protein